MSSEASQPTRVLLNFAHRCALKCEWCYVPFGGPPAREKDVTAIVNRVAELGFRTLTIGGGDPFQYAFIGRILKHAKAAGLFVHVDTHANSLRQSAETKTLLVETVDLLGLPLDGASPDIHDQMRSRPGHFDILQKRFAWLADFSARMKINTMISAINIQHLEGISELVAHLAPSRWSIYQYWPLGPAGSCREIHYLPALTFRAATQPLLGRFRDINVEVSQGDDRRLTYPIVHHDGSLHIHQAVPTNDFLKLGSIFDDSAVTEMFARCGSERTHARTRYG